VARRARIKFGEAQATGGRSVLCGVPGEITGRESPDFRGLIPISTVQEPRGNRTHHAAIQGDFDSRLVLPNVKATSPIERRMKRYAGAVLAGQVPHFTNTFLGFLIPKLFMLMELSVLAAWDDDA
jgi:hypothetical protein